MNRTRCPWCGKTLDNKKDTRTWNDVFGSSMVPRMLHQGNCVHCRRKYGQAPVFLFNIKVYIISAVLFIIGCVVQSLFLVVGSPFLVLLNFLTPYAKLDDRGKPPEINSDAFCAFDIIEKYDNFKPYELYFLEDDFDDYEPFVLASPIQIQQVSQKDETIYGEFLYIRERNYDYIEKDSCLLYDTNMKLVAKIKFREAE